MSSFMPERKKESYYVVVAAEIRVTIRGYLINMSIKFIIISNYCLLSLSIKNVKFIST